MYSDDTTVPLYITPPKSLVVFMPWYASTPRGVLLQILAVLAADAGILVLSRVYTTVVFACAFAVDFDWISRVGVGGRIWVQVWVSSRAHVTCGRDAGRWGRLRSGHNLCECFVRHTILLFDPESILHPLTTRASALLLQNRPFASRARVTLGLTKVWCA